MFALLGTNGAGKTTTIEVFEGLRRPSAGRVRVLVMPIALAIVMVLGAHHHLITVYAARRQELALKRLRAGVPSDATILAGTASGAVAIFLGQAVVIAAYGVVALRLPVPANPLTLVLWGCCRRSRWWPRRRRPCPR